MIMGILECWTNRPEWMAYGDFADWFPPFLRKADSDLTFQTYHAHHGELPETPTGCDAWLITGSAVSVYEDLPWQADLVAFLRDARGQRPIIGVCYGHQLLHYAFGGTVNKATGWGVGVHEYTADPKLGVSELCLLASHQDQVTQAAPDSRVLASSAFCPIAATQIGADMISIQPHPEMTVALAREVFAARRDEQGNEVTDAALASLDTPLDDVAVARWIVSFLRDFETVKREVT